MQFVDLEVANTSVGVQLESGQTYAILDARFRSIASGTAIQTGGQPLFLENATVDGSVRFLVDKSTALGPSLPASKAYWQGKAVIDGQHSKKSAGLVAASRMKRVSRPRPFFDPRTAAPDPANVYKFGAVGDGLADDTAAFKRAIAASEIVFVPWGLFKITDTLVLQSNTKIIGEGMAHIWLGNSSAGFDDINAPKPLIRTPDDPSAEIWLADLRLYCGSGNRTCHQYTE